MGDLFLHVPFARRLRYAEGLHPLAREALVRKSPQLAFAAALPGLPVASTKAGGLFSRLFNRGKGEALKWQEQLAPSSEPRGELVLRMLAAGSEAAPGPLNRLSLGLGVLSHELLAAELDPIYEGLDAQMRSAVERGQARLWLQFAVPSRRDLEHEWAPALAFHEIDSHKASLTHTDAALKAVLGQAPGRDMVGKWAKALFTEVTPLLEKGGMPDAGTIADHAVKARYYEGDAKFLDHVQNATTRFVFLAGRVAACFLGDDPDTDTLRGALMTDDGKLRRAPGSDELAADQTRWTTSIADARVEVLTRGRNEKAAFDGEGLLDNLPDLPPLPPDAEESGKAPTVTQEVSLAQIEAEMGGLSGDGEAEGATPPRAPASTQQISAADIEAEAGEGSATPPPPPETSDANATAPPPAPTSTQQISATDIEAELVSETPAAPGAPPPAPTSTQQISAADIQAELVSEAPVAPGAPPPVPTSTQQISAADIQAEMASTPPTPPLDDLPPLQVPAHTQQISAVDIEAEVIAEAGGAPPPAPTSTQQISAADIETEMAAMTSDPMRAPPQTQAVGADDIQAQTAQPPAPPTTDPGAAETQAAAQPPAAQPPAAQPPAAQPPAAQPPAAQPPAAQPPAAQPPVAQPPAAQPAAAQPPAAQPPAAQPPAAQPPAAQPPVAQPPAAQPPAAAPAPAASPPAVPTAQPSAAPAGNGAVPAAQDDKPQPAAPAAPVEPPPSDG
jgi:hypothetical protein